MFPLIFAWTNDWVHNRDTGDLRRHRGHYDVTTMIVYVIDLTYVSEKVFSRIFYEISQ